MLTAFGYAREMTDALSLSGFFSQKYMTFIMNISANDNLALFDKFEPFDFAKGPPTFVGQKWIKLFPYAVQLVRNRVSETF